MRTFLVTVAVALVTLLATVPATAQGLDDPIPRTIKQGGVHVTLDTVADGLVSPLWATSAPGLDGSLFVVDQAGQLSAIDLDSDARTVVLDVSNLLVPLGAFGAGTFDERGFLGVAFHPDYASNGLLYTYTSQPADGEADFSTMPEGVEPNHQTVVTEWRSTDPADATAAIDAGSARELLRIDEPQFNHNAGAIEFDASGNLLIALGDGGGADDQGVGHVDGGNGQDPSNPLGSILRIDPLGDDSTNGRYGIPTDNPVVGDHSALDETFAYGFRNPYRISVDDATGTIWAADVGQNDIEEVDIVEAGGNYGWRVKEGTFLFDPNGADPGFVTERSPGAPAGLIDPVVEYDHDEGIAIVGGFVYRGDAIPQLRGRYVFGEFLDPDTGAGRLLYLAPNGRVAEFRLENADGLGAFVLGFGQDADGEIYVLTNETSVPFGDTGAVRRLAPFRGPR
ncbi:MAG: PQQ-dependent sugar dehydrogenase [Actinobacteria bacterium]|nr:PQQ-dependent sugar dehydrogenase [Actinomycetota bacterium]